MEFIQTEYRGSVALVRLDRDVTNPIDLQLLHQLGETLTKIQEDSNARSVVLQSTNDKFFSIGFHIPQLFELTRVEFRIFYHTFNQFCIDLYTFPKPTVAAITGHAIAGGCILALCCDYRFIAEGRKLMGLNEVKLGVPVPYPGDCILRDLVGVRYAREIMELGEFYEPLDSLRMGLVDHVSKLEKVLPQAIEKAEKLGGMSNKPFDIIKKNRVEPVESQIHKHLEGKEDLFLECWFSEEARRQLQEALKRF